MKKYIISCALLSISFVCMAQYSVEQFLQSYRKEESVVFQKQKYKSLHPYAFRLPIIDKVEVRTETDIFDLRKQEYVVRISPNSRKSIKTQRQFQETVRYITQMEWAQAKSIALKERYDLVVDYIYSKKILAIKNKQAKLLKDKVTLLQRSISLSDFDVMELIAAEEDAQKNKREIMDLENRLLTTQNNIQRSCHSSNSLEIISKDLISPRKIKNLLEELKNKNIPHPVLEIQSGKVYNKMLEYQWEDAKTKFSLGYIQAKYSFDIGDGLEKKFSIGVGFDIPLKDRGRLNLNELQVDIHAEESKFRNLKSEIEGARFYFLQKLNNDIKKYELIAAQLKKGRSEHVLREYRKIAETPPKAIVKLRENTLALDLLLQKMEYEIVKTFIDYLDYLGLLGREPFRNYLEG